MNSPSPGARAVSLYEVADVFLVESHCRVAREFNQTQQVPEVTYGHTSGVAPECLLQTRVPVGDGNPVHILRYFVNSEVRFLNPGTQVAEGQEPSEQDFLAVLKFVFAADYLCPAEAFDDADAVSSFGRNAYFHAWPYLREELHSACARLRLPRITLPMLKPDQAAVARTMSKQTASGENE